MAEMNYTRVAREVEYQENYSVSAFVDYLETQLCWSSSGRKHHHFRWIFWSSEDEQLEATETIALSSIPGYQETIIKQKIKFALQEIIESYIDYCLVQFWAPKKRGGRLFLTTSDQPFAVDWLCKGLCWYRKQCWSHDYSVDADANEAELGPPGRVFRTGLPESSPDLRLYSIKEYPLRNPSLSCGIRAYMALPVFEMLGQNCVGVLEFVVFSAGYINIINEVEEGLKTADLRCGAANINHPRTPPGQLLENEDYRRRRQALKEIDVMFDILKSSHQLYLAQAWIASKHCAEANDNGTNSGAILFEQAKHKVYVEDEEQYNSSTTHFLKASKLHALIIGNGIAGRLLTAYKSFFCPNICNFSITEFPLLHYARLARLTASFSICLQSILTGDEIYVFEFFLLPGSSDAEYCWSSLPFLMKIMEQQLRSFKFLSGKLLGEGLSVKAIEFSKDNGYVDYNCKLDQYTPYPLKFEILRYREDLEILLTAFHKLHFGRDAMESSTVAVATSEQNNIDTDAITRASKREREKQRFRIRYQDLEPYFGKTLRDAEKGLGVSRSTLKRACRDHNITRWPSSERNKVNPWLFRNESSYVRQLGKNSMSPPSHLDFMTVEADFKGDTVKFKLPLLSGMVKLEEEVGRRLKLNVNSFRVKYMDEDGKWILLTCDDDLEFCVERLVSSGCDLVRMLVQL